MNLNTPNLNLPYIAAAQAQKHVTHNEAIRALDALLQIAVVDRDLTVAPTQPVEGARYLVAAGSTGGWAGKTGQLAAWQDGAWAFFEPRTGWTVWVADEGALIVFDGGSWVAVSAAGGSNGGPNPAPLVGVNTVADPTNRLSVASPGSLFDAEGGSHRLTVNKAAPADTASHVFQSAYSGRAEVGLSGDDDLRVKVSSNGTAWKDGIVIDRQTGIVSMPNTRLAFQAGSRVTQTAPTTITTAGTLMSWNVLDYNAGGFFDPARPTRMTVPAGVQQVMLFGAVYINTSLQGGGAPGMSYVALQQKSATGAVKETLYYGSTRITGLFEGAMLMPSPLTAAEGDYFEVVAHALSEPGPAYEVGLNYFAIAALA